MRILFFFILILISCSIKNASTSKKIDSVTQKESLELYFKLSKNKIKRYSSWKEEDEDFYATLIQTNRTDSILTVPITLTYGHKGEGDYVEAYNFNGKQIDINNQAHYQWLHWWEDDYFTTLKPSESRLDTISINSFYDFKEKGDFKLRFVYLFSEDSIYSNWDTLKVY